MFTLGLAIVNLAEAAGVLPLPVSQKNLREPVEAVRHLDTLNAKIARINETILSNSIYYYGSAARTGSSRAFAAYLEKARREETRLVIESALLTERIQRFRKTGVLAELDPATINSITRLIKEPFLKRTPVPELSLDIETLRKQLHSVPVKEMTAPPPIPRIKQDAKMPELKLDRPRESGRVLIDPIPGLLQQLSSKDPAARARAADELSYLRGAAKTAKRLLLNMISDGDRRVRASAASALGSIEEPDPSIDSALDQAIHDKDADVRFSAEVSLRARTSLRKK